MMTVYLGNRETVYLNTEEVIREAFVKHGHSFAGRPQDIFWMKELCDGIGKILSQNCLVFTARISNGMREGNVFTDVCPFTEGGTPARSGQGYPSWDGIPPIQRWGTPSRDRVPPVRDWVPPAREGVPPPQPGMGTPWGIPLG